MYATYPDWQREDECLKPCMTLRIRISISIIVAIAYKEMYTLDPSSAELLERLALRHGILLAQPAPHDK